MSQYFKKCFKCKSVKSATDFYKHKKMADGYLGKCKECAKKDIRIFRRDNEHVRIYDKERYHFNAQRKENIRDTQLDWNIKNPLGRQAHHAVSNAIKDGKLIKQPCQICGVTENIHAHHKDYLKPLEVQWFCARHHSKLHNPEKD